MRNLALAVAVTMFVPCIGATAQDTIDLTSAWRFKPDPDNTGVSGEWYARDHPEEDWSALDAGKRWEDQGFADVDGYAWYRRWVDVPGAWEGRPVWFVLGGLNDAGTLFCNGERANSYGDNDAHSMNDTPIIAELSEYVRFGERNLLAVQVFDWGASGGLWQPPSILTADAGQLPLDNVLTCYADAVAMKLVAGVDFSGLGNERPDADLLVQVRRGGDGAPLAESTATLEPGEHSKDIEFLLPDAKPGVTYQVQAMAMGPYTDPLENVVAMREVCWPEPPGWPGDRGRLKVLNNFVTELLATDSVAKDSVNYLFANPRDGWVFVSLSEGAARPPEASIRGDALVWRVHPKTGAYEAMRFLPEGKYRLRMKGVRGMRLDVCAIPEIAFCYYPSARHIEAYGPYDWAFAERHVLSDVNVLISRADIPPAEFHLWLSEGRKWIANASLPGLSDPEPPAAGSVYETWAGNRGASQPGFAGLMVDEFITAGADHYRAWGEAVRLLVKTPAFEDRTFYAWCGDLYQRGHAREFGRLVMDLGHRFSWERYLREAPTPDEARRMIFSEIVRPFERWKAALPGVEHRMVMCLGYLSAPPETLNLDPAVDYHVFMDMQFNLLATEPAFWGLYGIMEYMAAYADEESLRYAQRLFRHYCIEGARARLNKDPYLLTHIHNPDFADGLEGWRAEPAGDGSISARQMEGFSWLQGRYPQTSAGNQFCCMKRSAERPNRITQTIRALEPGRAYSVKLISADIGQLGEKQLLAMKIDVGGAETLDTDGFQFVYPSCYSHETGPYARDHPAYFNFHRVVFRATAPTAQLVISDWTSPAEPGGPAGQEIAFNFVEVQPFHEP